MLKHIKFLTFLNLCVKLENSLTLSSYVYIRKQFNTFQLHFPHFSEFPEIAVEGA